MRDIHTRLLFINGERELELRIYLVGGHQTALVVVVVPLHPTTALVPGHDVAAAAAAAAMASLATPPTREAKTVKPVVVHLHRPKDVQYV